MNKSHLQIFIRNNVSLIIITLESPELGRCHWCLSGTALDQKPGRTCPGTVLRQDEVKLADHGHTGHSSI